jgi:hypothetical protein
MSLYDTAMLLYYEEVADAVVESNSSLAHNVSLDKQDVLEISEWLLQEETS